MIELSSEGEPECRPPGLWAKLGKHRTVLQQNADVDRVDDESIEMADPVFDSLKDRLLKGTSVGEVLPEGHAGLAAKMTLIHLAEHPVAVGAGPSDDSVGLGHSRRLVRAVSRSAGRMDRFRR